MQVNIDNQGFQVYGNLGPNMPQGPKKDIGVTILKWVFGGVGFLFLILGIVFGFMSYKYKTEGVKTEAVIEDIEVVMSSHRDSDGHRRREHKVYVSYEVDGDWYYECLNAYNSNMKIGKTISIYYMEDNPSKILDVSTFMIIGIVFGSIGFVFVIIFLIVAIKFRRRPVNPLQYY